MILPRRVATKDRGRVLWFNRAGTSYVLSYRLSCCPQLFAAIGASNVAAAAPSSYHHGGRIVCGPEVSDQGREALPITADGYYWTYSQFVPPKKKTGVGTFTSLVAAEGSWSGAYSGSASLGSKDASHAERTAYTAMTAKVGQSKAFYLFVQNAFPCEECLKFFQAASADSYFIFVISEDQGSYSLDNGLKGHQISYPQILYIQGGKRWYPGYVTFWTSADDGSKDRISVRALRSCNDPNILAADGSVKKPQTWPDFPSIAKYLKA